MPFLRIETKTPTETEKQIEVLSSENEMLREQISALNFKVEQFEKNNVELAAFKTMMEKIQRNQDNFEVQQAEHWLKSYGEMDSVDRLAVECGKITVEDMIFRVWKVECSIGNQQEARARMTFADAKAVSDRAIVEMQRGLVWRKEWLKSKGFSDKDIQTAIDRMLVKS